MTFDVISDNGGNKGILKLNDQWVKCALGKNGTIDASLKREGDGKSPIGNWPIRKIYYRADRVERPITPFETIIIEKDFGWCDAQNDINYNKFVRHPYPQSAEKMWRDDGLYDICVVLGHNDDPVIDNMGSAIFLHCMKGDYHYTEGCVALKLADLQELLSIADEKSTINIIS